MGAPPGDFASIYGGDDTRIEACRAGRPVSRVYSRAEKHDPRRLAGAKPMTTIYAIGDIHGEKALLDDLHRQIIADAAARPGDKLAVYLGDYIDRGPDSRGVVSTLMAGPLPFPAVCLMGNHEALCLAPCPDDWLANGGRQTQASYGGAVTPSHREWMRDLPLAHRHGRWFFAHAGIDPALPLARQEGKPCSGSDGRFWTSKASCRKGSWSS